MSGSKAVPLIAAMAFLIGCGVFTVAARDAGDSEKEDSATPATHEEPIIEARVAQLVSDTSNYLKEIKSFSFQAAITYDGVLPNGQKIQYGGTIKFAVRRPDRLYVEYRGDRGDKRFWYDGKTFTVWDSSTNTYANTAAPARLDKALDELTVKFGLTLPLSDLAYDNPYDVRSEDMVYAFYVGRHEVNGTPCSHVAASQEEIDWQLWIEDDTRLLPRKVVITYRTVPQEPQYTAVFTRWDLSVPLPDRLFRASPPEGARKIDFLPIEGGPVR